jgi:hypothetical protein
LLPKDRCGCQRSGPSDGTEPTKEQPRVAAGQRTGARRHEDQDRSRTALDPRTPRAGSPEGAADRPARKEQPLRCRSPI